MRNKLCKEPGAEKLHAGICGGQASQGACLPDTTQNLLDNMGKFVQQKPTCGESEHGYTQRSRI